MRRTELQEGIRMLRFEEAYEGWVQKRFSQEEAARLLGVCPRSFRRYVQRVEQGGLEALADKRLHQMSHWRIPVNEAMALVGLYKDRYLGWNVKHFHHFYKQKHGGTRSYSWVKNTLQSNGLVTKHSAKGKHRKRRERSPAEGMMIHQDGSKHEWIPNCHWDLIITLDDATSTHYSMFFVQEEGTASSFQGVKETIEKKGLFCSFYSDRGSHYWTTPEAGGPVDKYNLTQFGRAMKQLGITMIAAYSPQARGRCERMFGTHQERLPKELALHGITDMDLANEYLRTQYLPAFNEEFSEKSSQEGSAFVAWQSTISLNDILCEQYERQVGNNNCVQFKGMILQIPADKYRCHYIKVKVNVHLYCNGEIAVFHGPRLLARYDRKGQLQVIAKNGVAA